MSKPVEPASHPPSGGQPGKPSDAPPAKPGVRKRWLLAILALTFLFVLMPFLFWQATWFGRPLNDAQMEKSLADREHPRAMQHALSQVADRILSPNPTTRQSARRFYPAVVDIAQSGSDALRLTAAWVMGQDNSIPEFHQELVRLLADPNPMVRRNAALALVRFADLAGRGEIRAMLEPYPMPAPRAGTLVARMKPGDAVNPGTLLGRITAGGGDMEVRSDISGTIDRWLVPDGATVTAGQPILLVVPSDAEVREALRALSLIGEKQDLPAVERFSDHTSANLRRQAAATAQSIRSRP